MAVDELRVFMWFIISISFTVESFTEKRGVKGVSRCRKGVFYFWNFIRKELLLRLAFLSFGFLSSLKSLKMF